MLETTKYARKPFVVEGVRVTDENMEDVAAWCNGDIRTNTEDGSNKRYIKVRVHRPLTDRQSMAFAGDWVLYAGTGYKVYTNKAFHKSFEKATVLTKEMADDAGIRPGIEKKESNMDEQQTPKGDVQDPAEAKRVDTAVETTPQPEPGTAVVPGVEVSAPDPRAEEVAVTEVSEPEDNDFE